MGKSKFAVSSGPVNRRTAAPAPKTERPASVVLNRLKARQVKHRLGTPLLQRLNAGYARTDSRAATSRALVLQAVACTLGGTAIFLGAIQSAWGLLAAGGVTLLGTAAWAGLQWRSRKQHAGGEHTMAAWIAPSDMERLDGLLEQLAQESGQATVNALCQLKDRLSRCVQLLGNSPDGAAPDDALFVRETVRRYLPDSIQASLKIAAQDRGTQVIEQGKTATALLHDQLALLDQELQTREARLAPLAGEALLQQQRFLAAKTQSTGM